MNCEEMLRLLDAYIDGALTDEEVCALKAHAKTCESCMRELEAAELLKDTLAHMDDDIAVPLEAQAAWRNAVRKEAAGTKQKNKRVWLRAVYAVAAALVLVLGGNAILHNMPADTNNDDNQLLSMTNVSPNAAHVMIARDGGKQPAYSGEVKQDAYSVWRKIKVDSLADAKEKLKMLSEEYNGVFSMDGEDICRIELPYEYMEDFLKASSRVGNELYLEISDEEALTAVVLVQLCCD